ncbi:MAG: hypothetical protein ABW328_14450 [Ilumatobacteraceae bacterium]
MTGDPGAGLASLPVAMGDGTEPRASDEASVAVVDAPGAPSEVPETPDVEVDDGTVDEPAIVTTSERTRGAAGPSLPRRIVRRIVRRPVDWAQRPWPTSRVVQVAVTGVTLFITTVVMMNVVHLNPLNMRSDLVLDNTTPTGGDMGAHVWGPAYLRDNLLPHLQLSGWSMDWYAGMPVYRFYMVVPALAIVALDAVVPYGVAFKLIAVSGLVSLPFCCWAFGRLAKFRAPIPELFAFAGLCFALDESFSIYGGNLKSTMAGEFSFSIALSLMVLGLGLLAAGMRTGRYRSWAAIVLALAIVSHGIVAIYTVLGALIIVLVNLDSVKRFVYGLSVGLGVILLSAWWIGPFVGNHQYMTDMKYGARPEGAADSFWDMFFPLTAPLDAVVTVLAVIGFASSIGRRHANGTALGVIGLVTVALVYLTQDSLPVIGLLWNPRLLPLIYFVRYLLMMVGVVEVVGWLVNAWRDRGARDETGWVVGSATVAGVGLVVLIVLGFMFEILPGDGRRVVHDASKPVYAWGPLRKTETAGDAQGDGWSRYNFAGYEGRSQYPEYYDVVQRLGQIGETNGCGRVTWENNEDNGQYGTTMALMLLPHWTDGCMASMEGLFFEASGTTPYHFLTTAAMSKQSSNPVRELRYDNNDASIGVPYLQALGVRYVMVRTQEAKDQAATRPELTLLATSGPWEIYQVADSDIVEPLTVQPVVVDRRSGDQRERNLELGTSWFQHRDEWAAMPADDGPAEWQNIDVSVDQKRLVPDPNRSADDPDTRGKQVDIVVPDEAIDPVELPPVEVSDVVIGEQEVSFHVDEVGVPVLVKVSYFPNWAVDGAEGPYRIAPNFMVVIPTEQDVNLHFERSRSDMFFYLLTFVGIAMLVVLRIRGDADFSSPAPAGAAPAGAGPPLDASTAPVGAEWADAAEGPPYDPVPGDAVDPGGADGGPPGDPAPGDDVLRGGHDEWPPAPRSTSPAEESSDGGRADPVA